MFYSGLLVPHCVIATSRNYAQNPRGGPRLRFKLKTPTPADLQNGR